MEYKAFSEAITSKVATEANLASWEAWALFLKAVIMSENCPNMSRFVRSENVSEGVLYKAHYFQDWDEGDGMGTVHVDKAGNHVAYGDLTRGGIVLIDAPLI